MCLGRISITPPLSHRFSALGCSDIRKHSISLALSQDASHNRSRCNITPRIAGILPGAADYLERCFRRNTFAQDQGEPEALGGWRVCARGETPSFWAVTKD